MDRGRSLRRRPAKLFLCGASVTIIVGLGTLGFNAFLQPVDRILVPPRTRTATPPGYIQVSENSSPFGSYAFVGAAMSAIGMFALRQGVRSSGVRRKVFSSVRDSLRPCHVSANGRFPRSASRIGLSAKKSVADLNTLDLRGRRILVRCDLNVPLDSQLAITDDTRIRASIPTLQYLSDHGAKVIACSHLGRPKGKVNEQMSLMPVAKRLGELMGKDIKFAPDCVATDEVRSIAESMIDGDVVVLENTRFHIGETENDDELARSMASLADLYVNDAFGSAHRAHASTEGVTRYLRPSVSGFLLKKELDYLQAAVDTPKRPLAAIVGGAKVSTKIPVIESMLDKVDKLVIGGGMVFTFLRAKGLPVGSSLVEDDFVDLARKLLQKAKSKGVDIVLPDDIACGDAFPADGKQVGYRIVPVDGIPDGWMGLDNGPRSTEKIRSALADCKTIIWNGPMGVFESPQFARGTDDVAKCIGELTEKHGATSIIGGGDSVAAVNKAGLASKMSHISTGGGASLELLEGKTLPGVAALDEA